MKTRCLLAAAALLLFGVALLRTPPIRPAERMAELHETRQPALPAVVPPSPPVMAPPAIAAPEPSTLLAGLAKALREGDTDEARRLLVLLRAAILPKMPPAERNAALLYQKAFDLFAAAPYVAAEQAAFDKASSGGALTPEEREALRSFMANRKDAFKLLHDAAQLPDCVFPVAYDDGFAALLPHIGPSIRASKLLRCEAMLFRFDGDEPAAAAATMAGLALSRGVRNDTLLVSQLVAIVVDGIGSADAMRSLDDEMAETMAWARGVNPSIPRDAMARSLYGEVVIAVDLYLKGQREPLGDDASRVLDNPLKLQDAAFYVETMQKMIELSARPYAESRMELDAIEANPMPWYAEGSKLVLPAISRAARNAAVTESMLVKARLAAALKDYRARTGTYPVALEILGTPPRDPLTGLPVLYRQDGAGFVLETPENENATWRATK